jgi:P4 family phage/plasmid primase-like protien
MAGTTVSPIFNQPGATFVLLPAGVKYPPLERGWQERGHSFEEAAAHAGNVGILAGNGYGGLDQDDPRAFEGLTLPETTTWETRPGRLGMQLRWSDNIAKVLAKYGFKLDQAQIHLFDPKQIEEDEKRQSIYRHVGEVKLGRSYQVVPPSWKALEGGQRVSYRMIQEVPPVEVSLDWLLSELLRIGLVFSKKPKVSRLESNAERLEAMVREGRQKRAETDDQRARRYAEAALKSEVEAVRSAPKGHRNQQLNDSAFALGQFVAAGLLSESEVIRALEGVAEDDEPEKIGPTIRSGLEAGMRSPREVPESQSACNRAQEKARSEKKTTSIELEDVADIEYDKNDKIKKIRFSPTFATRVVLDKIPLAMSEDSENIYRFNGQIYEPDGARAIDRALCSAAGDHVTADKLRETLRRIRNELLESPVTFDPDPYLLGVKNGVANLLTGEVREYRPEDLILDQLEVSYDPGARCPMFLRFLESVTPNISDRITLIDWFAATAIKEPLAYVLFLLGLGRNGKGIYEKLIKRFFGQSAFRDMPLAEVGKNNFAAGGFYRKRGWIASETGKRKNSIGTDFIKLTSGNGVIDSDRKNQSRIQFEPYFQTIVDTNTMPKIEDNSIGWMERFVKVDLPYVFVANPDPENPLEKQRDSALFEKLSTPSELSGILNLLLFRSQAIGRSRTIHKRSGAEMFAEYSEQSSSVATFLDLFCEFDGDISGLWTPSEQIYEYYRTWCGYKVGEVVDRAYFGRQLKKFCGGLASKQGKTKDRRSITMYKGLIFDQNKYQAAIGALQISMSEVCPKMSEVCLRKENRILGQQITMSEVSEVDVWNEILRRFRDHPKDDVQKEDENLSGRESVNLPQTPKTPQTSIAGELVEKESTSDKPKTLPQTHQIEAELQQAEERAAEKEKHFTAKASKPKPKSPKHELSPSFQKYRGIMRSFAGKGPFDRETLISRGIDCGLDRAMIVKWIQSDNESGKIRSNGAGMLEVSA